jgi:hypothetical protein
VADISMKAGEITISIGRSLPTPRSGGRPYRLRRSNLVWFRAPVFDWLSLYFGAFLFGLGRLFCFQSIFRNHATPVVRLNFSV